MRKLACFLLLLGPAIGLAVRPGLAQPTSGNQEDKTALGKSAEDFIEAFHKGDFKALAAFWIADGDYTDQTGRQMKGREAIENGLKAFFATNKGLKLRIESESLRFLTPDVAVEDGTTYVLSPNGAPPSRARYSNVHVKKDGKWYLGSVRDAPYSPPSNYEHLEALEWVIGNWAADDGKGDAQHLSASWAEGQNFIVASFSASVKGVSVGRATHWIGWDPQTRRIRSWIFDAAGGFGEGAWTRDGNKWVVKTKSVLQDGKNATSTFCLGQGDGGSLTLQAKDRTMDGKPMPDGRDFKLSRVR